jgi:hypothetical protein
MERPAQGVPRWALPLPPASYLCVTSADSSLDIRGETKEVEDLGHSGSR